jgi:RNA polymerase sigma-70 factor, ECF subfamily
MLTTSASLLGHLQQADDPRAWERFVHLYSPVLCVWASRTGLQEADALDLVQEVFVTLVEKLPEFTYDSERSFRRWLFTVTRNKCMEKARRKTLRLDHRVRPDEIGSAVVDESVERSDFHSHLLTNLLPETSRFFQASTWQAFYAHVVEGQPAAKVAARLGITVSGVVKAKFRVLSRLHRELADLISE